MKHYRVYWLLAVGFLLQSWTPDGNQQVEGILYRDGKPVSIEIADGKISKINRLDRKPIQSDMYVAPGLVDIQINGYMGLDFSSQDITKERLQKAIKALWEHGVTTFLPTVVTHDSVRMKHSFELLSGILDDPQIARSIPGLHVEGPFISPEPGYRGAHLAKYIRKPDWKEFSGFQDASHNRIKIITVAPEVEGAIPFIEKCTGSGVIVSLGHHHGSTESIEEAVDSGARLCTHIGNGCANMINRHLNPLWPQLSNDQLSISVIADGFHLTREELRCFYKIKGPEKTILISDAVDLAGLPPGEYIRREKKLILTPEHVVRFPIENVLAGAANPLSVGVGNMMKFTECGLANAIRMASTNPANLVGLHDIGRIESGKRANLILFRIIDDQVVIMKTILDGQVVYENKNDK